MATSPRPGLKWSSAAASRSTCGIDGMTTRRRPEAPQPVRSSRVGLAGMMRSSRAQAKQPPEDCSDGALSAAGGGRAVAQGQVADYRVEVRQIEVTDPGAAQRRQDVDVQAGAFLR